MIRIDFIIVGIVVIIILFIICNDLFSLVIFIFFRGGLHTSSLCLGIHRWTHGLKRFLLTSLWCWNNFRCLCFVTSFCSSLIWGSYGLGVSHRGSLLFELLRVIFIFRLFVRITWGRFICFFLVRCFTSFGRALFLFIRDGRIFSLILVLLYLARNLELACT